MGISSPGWGRHSYKVHVQGSTPWVPTCRENWYSIQPHKLDSVGSIPTSTTSNSYELVNNPRGRSLI
jgi:hypothetical protein